MDFRTIIKIQLQYLIAMAQSKSWRAVCALATKRMRWETFVDTPIPLLNDDKKGLIYIKFKFKNTEKTIKAFIKKHISFFYVPKILATFKELSTNFGTSCLLL